MKWIENGISFEGTPAEYRELHADGFQQQPQRTRRGKHVTVDLSNSDMVDFPTVIEAAQWITQKTGRYVSSSTLGRMIDENGRVSLDRFTSNAANLFDNNPQTKGEE